MCSIWVQFLKNYGAQEDWLFAVCCPQCIHAVSARVLLHLSTCGTSMLQFSFWYLLSSRWYPLHGKMHWLCYRNISSKAPHKIWSVKFLIFTMMENWVYPLHFTHKYFIYRISFFSFKLLISYIDHQISMLSEDLNLIKFGKSFLHLPNLFQTPLQSQGLSNSN